MNKTCCDCAFLIDGYCGFHKKEIGIIEPVCDEFEPIPKPTNGDVIRQMNNRQLAELDKCDWCIYFDGVLCVKPDDKTCADGIEPYLNAPAESEGKDE